MTPTIDAMTIADNLVGVVSIASHGGPCARQHAQSLPLCGAVQIVYRCLGVSLPSWQRRADAAAFGDGNDHRHPFARDQVARAPEVLELSIPMTKDRSRGSVGRDPDDVAVVIDAVRL